MIGVLKDKKEEMILVAKKMNALKVEREMILLKETMEKMRTCGKKALIKIQICPLVKLKVELIPLKMTNNTVIKMLELMKQDLMLSMKGALQEKKEMILVMEKMEAVKVEREMILLKKIMKKMKMQ
jgi:hypothetical protein